MNTTTACSDAYSLDFIDRNIELHVSTNHNGDVCVCEIPN